MTTDPPGLSATANRKALLAAVTAVLAHAGPAADGLIAGAADETALSGDELVVTGSSSEGGARYRLAGASVAAPGEVSLALEPLARALRHAGSRTVSVEAGRDAAVVTIDPAARPPRRFEFPRPATRPPGPPAAAPAAALSAAAFRRLVARVAFAAERREREASPAGWATTGVLASVRAGRLTLAATDTHRLPLDRCPLGPGAADGSYLLPARAVRAFAEAARGLESVALALSPLGVVFEAGALTAWCPLLAGTFPPADRALADPPHGFAIDPARLLADVEAALAFCDPEDPVVVLAAAPGVVTVSPASGDRGTCELATPLPGFRGPRLTVSLHGPRLAGLLAAYAGSGPVELRWESAEKPLVVVAGEARCLVVPWAWKAAAGRTA